MFCSKCGKELNENTKSCVNCGTPIENMSQNIADKNISNNFTPYNNNDNFSMDPETNINNRIQTQQNNVISPNKQSAQFDVQKFIKSKKKIIVIVITVVAIVLVIFIFSKIFGGSSTVVKTIDIGKEANVRNKIYNMNISVGDTQRGVIYKDADSEFSFSNLDGTYTKVKVNIKNNSSKEALIGSTLVQIYLMDSSKNKIASCDYGVFVTDENLEKEKLQENIPANSTVNGYVYCKTDSTSDQFLNINIPSSTNSDDGNKYNINYDHYYFNLN